MEKSVGQSCDREFAVGLIPEQIGSQQSKFQESKIIVSFPRLEIKSYRIILHS